MSNPHTPLPWHIDGSNLSAIISCTVPRGHPDAKHTCGDYETIADCRGDNWKENATLIVRAVNSHAVLVEALRGMLELHIAHHNQPIHAAARAALAQLDKPE